MAEQWWTDEDRDVVHKFAWDVHDGGGSPYLSAGAAAKVLETLAPTVERIRREAKAEALREFADVIGPLADFIGKGADANGAGLLKAMAGDMRNRADRIEAGDA